MVLNKVNNIVIILFLFLSNSSIAYQIYDYQTDKLIEKLNSEILSVNSYNKKINFKIIKDDFPNAFVTEDSTLYISSGLFINCPNYISLLAVLAHEIGHLEKYHVVKRKSEIEDLKKVNSIGNIVAIAGSMIIQQPELINTIIVNQGTIKNLLLNFTQEQEREADIYAVETLNNLNLSKESVKEFLNILHNKTNSDLIDEELKKFSTHPSFKERIEILDIEKDYGLSNFDKKIEKDFNFIKAKFIAYTNSNLSGNLKGDEKLYYESIHYSISGRLLESLKRLNILIEKYKKNIFFIETKADILLSYGYNREALEFYKKVLSKYPKNYYAKFNIFINLNYKNKEINHLRKIFFENLNLINLYPSNQALLTKFYNLSKILELSDWKIFFNCLLFNKNNIQKTLIDLNKQTKDNNLKKIIKLYI